MAESMIIWCASRLLSHAYLPRLEKATPEDKDARILNAQAARLNEEACDVLVYQQLL